MKQTIAQFLYNTAISMLPTIWAALGPHLFDLVVADIQNGKLGIPGNLQQDAINILNDLKSKIFPTATPAA